MDNQEIFAPLIGRGQSSTLLAVNARGMGLIHHQEGIVALRDRDEVFKWREIAVHAVEAFDHNPDAARSAFGPPVPNRDFDRLGVVMGAYPELGPPSPRTFMDTRVHQRIEHDQIAPLRQCCQDSKICDITAAKEERRLCSEEPRGLCFETFVLLAVAAQKPRPAGPDGGAGLNRRGDSLSHTRRARQREIIVRCEIDSGTRLEAAQPIVVFQGLQVCDVPGNLV